MIRSIVRDVFFLGQKADPATKQELLSDGQDLRMHYRTCVGIAENLPWDNALE